MYILCLEGNGAKFPLPKCAFMERVKKSNFGVEKSEKTAKPCYQG